MEYQKIASRMDNKLNGSAYIVADQSVLMTIRYKGSEASATVTVANGDITFKHGTSGSESADSTVGASGVVADGTYTTLGAMVDAINISPNWSAELVDALRSDSSTAALKALSEYRFSPKTEIVNLYADTSATLNLSYLISARRGNYRKSQKDKQSFLQVLKAYSDITSGTLTMYVYDVDLAHSTARKLYQASGTDATTFSDTTFVDSPIISDWGHELLVRWVGSAELPDSGSYLAVGGFVA